jgi:hypothetical protein
LDSQILWLSLSGANLMMAHGVGVPSNHSTTELSMSLRDETVANQIWWFLSQPHSELTASSQPKNLS